MNQVEKNLRDVARDAGDTLYYKGYTFPKYEGMVTQDEYNSRQTFYAFWGDQYLTAMAIRYHVDQALLLHRIPLAA